MNNIFLIYGNEDYLIKKELDNILKNGNILEDNIITYNLDETNVINALEEASTVSMFDSKKAVICEGCTFLTGENKKEINHDIDSLIKYINNPFDDVYLIFIVRREKLDERKKIVKEIKKLSKVFECNKIENYNLSNYIDEYIKNKGYKINKICINKIIEIAGYDLSRLINEVDKLLIYKDDDKNIAIEDVTNVISKSIEDNVFELTNAIMEKNEARIIKIYKDLLLSGEESIKLIVLIANQLRLILQVKLMIKNGYKESEMASIISEHPYRIKLAIKSKFKIKELIYYLDELEELDYNIKSGKVDKDFGLEMFLYNIKRN